MPIVRPRRTRANLNPSPTEPDSIPKTPYRRTRIDGSPVQDRAPHEANRLEEHQVGRIIRPHRRLSTKDRSLSVQSSFLRAASLPTGSSEPTIHTLAMWRPFKGASAARKDLRDEVQRQWENPLALIFR